MRSLSDQHLSSLYLCLLALIIRRPLGCGLVRVDLHSEAICHCVVRAAARDLVHLGLVYLVDVGDGPDRLAAKFELEFQRFKFVNLLERCRCRAHEVHGVSGCTFHALAWHPLLLQHLQACVLGCSHMLWL